MTQQFNLWGYKASYGITEPIRLSGGSLGSCRADRAMREREGGWLLGIYPVGAAPTGLRLRVAEQRKR